MVMQQIISKSQLKPQLLQYLRMVEQKKQPLIVTHGGKPVVKIVPYKEKPARDALLRTVLKYNNPTDPIGGNDWELV